MGKIEGTFSEAGPVVIVAQGDTVTIPDAHLLFSGDFARIGTDLVITGGGESVVVADYFGAAGMPALASPTGAVLLPDVVSALAGPQAPGQFAQAGDLEPGEGIGSVVTVSGSATVQRSDGTVVDLGVDSRVAEGDVVQTGSGSALGIVFDDGAVFNLNADSRMVLNEMVYEPGGSSNSMLFSVVQGVFAFVAGQVAPTGEMRVDTPAATMGIRGTSGLGRVTTEDGNVVLQVIPDPVTNYVGTIVLFSPGTDVILAVMDSSGSQWSIDPATGEATEQPADPANEDIIQQLHDTFIRFAGTPTEQGEDQQQASDSGGSGLETAFTPTSMETPIVSLTEGALGETESLDGETSTSGVVIVSDPAPAGDPILQTTSLPPALVPTSGPPQPTQPIVDNAAPVAGNDQLGTAQAPHIDENSLALIPSTVLLANDSDPDNDGLTIIAVSGTSALGATVILGANGTVGYDPRIALNDLAAGEVVIDTFTYTVSDGQGGTSQATVSVAVAGVTDVVAADDEFETAEDTPVTFNVLANDADAELVVSFTELSDPELGSLVHLGDGSFVFTPGLNASGTTTFNYQAGNGTGEATGGVATVSIVVAPVADAPRLGVGEALGVEGDDITSWDSLGDVTLVASHEDQVPTDGELMVRLAAGGATEAEIEALLGLAPGALDANANGDVTEGAAVTADLQVAAGDVITFDWNFAEKDYLPFRDYAFVTIEGALVKLAEVNNSVENAEWTGWQTYSFVAPTTGTLTLGFGIVDVEDESLDAELLIANLRHSSGQVEGQADSAIALPIAASLADIDGSETLSVVIAGIPEGAVLSAGTNNGDGTWTLTPAQLANLSVTPPSGSQDDFTLTVTATARETATGDVASTTRTLEVVVLAPNPAPVAQGDTFATDGETGLNGNVLANDSDPDGDPLTLIEVNGSAVNFGAPVILASNALLTVNADGSFAYDPNGQFETLGAGATAQDSFTYTISDDLGGTDTATVTIEIAGINDAPAAEALAGSVSEDAASFAVDLLTDASDVDEGDVLSVQAVDTTIITAGERSLELDTHYEVNGSTFELTAAGLALFDSLAEGVDDSFVVNFEVTDGVEAVANTLAVTVEGANDAPLVATLLLAADEDETDLSVDLLITASDVDDGDELSVQSVDTAITTTGGRELEIGTHYTVVDGIATLTADGIALFDSLAEGAEDTVVLNYEVTDGIDAVANTLTVVIEGLNDAPVVEALDRSVSEDAASFAVDLLTGATDIDEGDVLSVQSVDTSITTADERILFLGTHYEVNGSVFELTPDGFAQFEGLADGASDSFVVDFFVDDGLVSVANTLTVTVGGANDAPTAAEDQVETDEDTVLNGDVLANDSDPNLDELMVTHVNGSTTNLGTQIALASGALLLLSADGTFAYDPNGQFDFLDVGDTAVDSFEYTITDGNGGTDTATVTITINGLNAAPGATDSIVATNDGVPAEGMLTGADAEGDALTFSLEEDAANGSVVVNPDGSFTYTPDAEFTGSDSFTYGVTDVHGGFDTATVAVDVAPQDAGEEPKILGGTDGNDVLIGSSLNDDLFGGLGNDVLRSGGAPQDFFGLDRLDGGPGDDTLVAEGGAAILVGGPGNDVLTRDLTQEWYDWVRADYGTSDAGIVANFTDGMIGDLAPGEVADGFGTVDQVSFMHVIQDSPHDDAFHVDESYSDGFSNFIEVRLSGGDDTVDFDNVDHARIGYNRAGGAVLADLETGTATDLDPNDSFIGSDTFTGKVHVLRGSQFNDELYGSSGDEFFRGEGGDDYIDGRGGTNMLQFVSSPEGVHVDLSQNLVLNDGHWIEALDRHGIDEVHNIQNVSGSDFDDLIIGDAGNNRLFGGLGNDELRSGGAPQNFFGEDWLFGNEGDDTLIAEGGWVVLEGGAGNDALSSNDPGGNWDFVRADYRSSPEGIVADLTNITEFSPGQVADGFGTTDTVSGVHLIADSEYGDTISVDHTYLNSFGSWIEVRLTSGDDVVNFSGVNTARISYAQAMGPVLLDMDDAAAKDKPADYVFGDDFNAVVSSNEFIGNDSFVGATEARGSRYDDVLYGRWEANDILRGSGGDDYIDGRGGTNWITFGDSSSGIDVNLSNSSESRVMSDGIFIEALGRDGQDVVINIDNVRGSGWGDVIIGDDFDNVLHSGGTPENFFEFDFLDGAGGNDTLTAGSGSAVLVGGAGNDVLQSFDGGGWYDWVRADYTTSDSGIVANLTGDFINDLAPGQVDDGFGTVDYLAGNDVQGNGPTGVHVLADSPHDDVIHVDGSYQSSFGNWIEVRLSGGNDTVNFNGVFHARISYQQALGPVLLDMDLAQARDKPAGFDPVNDGFGDGVADTNVIGNDTFNGANSARGSNFDDVLLGRFEFDDTFRGSGGDDYIDGRGGNNWITFGDSSSGIHVDLSQSPESRVLDDGIAHQTLGRNGIDEVHNVQNVNGSDWDDLIIGDGGNNVLSGGRGDDELRSGGAPQEYAGADVLNGERGNDTLIAEGGFVMLRGGPGHDVLTSTDAGTHWDFVLADYRGSPGPIAANLTGGTITDPNSGNDLTSGQVADGFGTIDHVTNVHVIVDSPHNDVIYVDHTYTNSAGNWIGVRLSGGDDHVTFTDVDFARISYSYAQGPVLIDMEAGTGTDLDEFDNHIGDDTFTGATAARGSRFDDTILGRVDGNDDLRGNAGDDFIDGRGGINTISFSGAEFGVEVDLSQSPESRVLNDGHWNDATEAPGVDEVHNVQNVIGSEWDDQIIGDDGNNVLRGGIGDDSLAGGAGNDTLVGGPGEDSLNGGAGDDRFGFRSPDDGLDTIIDFGVSEDVLVIDASVFLGELVPGQGLSQDQFVSDDGPQPNENHGQFLYDSVLGELSWDVDGIGGEEAVHFATLAGAPTLTEANFEIIDAGGSFVGSSEIAAAVDGGGEPVA